MASKLCTHPKILSVQEQTMRFKKSCFKLGPFHQVYPFRALQVVVEDGYRSMPLLEDNVVEIRDA